MGQSIQPRHTCCSSLNSALDLRAVEGAEDQVRDIGNNLLVSEARVGGELLPVGIVAEKIPFRVELGVVREAQHVGEAWHPRAHQRVAEEDHAETSLGEDV